MEKILIVEDEEEIACGLSSVLKNQGYAAVIWDGRGGVREIIDASAPDLILLDLGLPDIDGMEVLGQIRQESEVPVIVVSARGMEQEKVGALDAGADDYITKPFNAGELLARIRVALRHRSSAPRQEPVFELDTLKLDFEKRKVSVRGEEVHLTPIEYKMLSLLVNNSGKVLTHHYIQQEVWGYDTTDDYQSLRVFMANIRRKIEEDSTKPRFILTEVGVGYRFVES